MRDRTIMQMEVHPKLILLRKERAERLKLMYAGMAQYQGPPIMGVGRLSGLGDLFHGFRVQEATGYCPLCGRS